MLNVYEAFCGIGGFSLGFQRAGFEIVGGCEIDPIARHVYSSRFGIAPKGDIREITDIDGADILCGGFPCQDVSHAGNRTGIEGKRSSLWKELSRLISLCKPKWIVVENVPGLFVRGFDIVLSDLAASGYDAEWDCLPASAFGAPHQRDRIWIVAYPNSKSVRQKSECIFGGGIQAKSCSNGQTFWSKTKPPIFGMDDGLWHRSYGARFKLLGNAIVPQIAQWIAERIIKIEMRR